MQFDGNPKQSLYKTKRNNMNLLKRNECDEERRLPATSTERCGAQIRSPMGGCFEKVKRHITNVKKLIQLLVVSFTNYKLHLRLN